MTTTTTTSSEQQQQHIVSRSYMTRNLRRRFWKALRDGNIHIAIKSYTCTKQQYDEWMNEEEQERYQEEVRLQQEQKRLAKQKKHRGLGKFMGKLGGSTRHLQQSSNSPARDDRGVRTGSSSLSPARSPTGSGSSKGAGGRRFSSSKKESSPDKQSTKQRRKSSKSNNNNNSKRWTVPNSASASHGGGAALHCCVPQQPPENSSEDSYNSSTPSSILEEDVVVTNNNNNGVLQNLFAPTSPFESDDFYDPHDDDYHVDKLAEQLLPPTNNNNNSRESSNPRQSGFRMPFFWDHRNNNNNTAAAAALARQEETASMDDDDEINNSSTVNEYMTTPLHEAARLGDPDLMRLLLKASSSSNASDDRNGMQRSPLHMVAGGLHPMEHAFLLQQGGTTTHNNDDEHATTVLEDNDGLGGIPIPIIPPYHPTQQTLPSNDHAPVQRAARALSKLWIKTTTTTSNQQDDDELLLSSKKKNKVSPSQFQHYSYRRAETLLLLLSQKDDVVSVNAVDRRGRTALHYASELGRTQVCTVLLEQFGTILTLIDESSRTPCELAFSKGHGDLAHHLEARSLLYMDPYGMDEDMMATMSTRHSTRHQSGSNSLEPPFCYFETWNLDTKVACERQERVQIVVCQMKERLLAYQTEEELSDFILNYGVNQEKKKDGQQQQQEDEEEEDSKMPAAATTTTTSTEDEESDKQKDDDEDKNEAEEEEKEEEEDNNDDDDDDDDDKKAAAVPTAPPDEKKHPTKPDGPYQHVIDSLQEAHAELYLISFSWNVDKAVEALEENAVEALTKAGIEISHPSERPNLEEGTTRSCQICFDEFSSDDSNWKVLEGCGHGFCTACLGDYITECARTREAGLCIPCPQHKCPMYLSQDEIQTLAPSLAILERCLDAANQNFVVAAKDLSYCPHAGCEGVVHRIIPDIIRSNKYDEDLVDLTGAVCTVCDDTTTTIHSDKKDIPLTYEGVCDANYLATTTTTTSDGEATQPKQAHRFCFACGDTRMHWPVPCEQLTKWKEKIRTEVSGLEGGAEGDDVNDIAQQLWMKANTRPCPKCKAPIEKNDGCNHMTCTNRSCRHEFCWICRQDWKLHNTETGGFFRCNRWQGDEKHEYYDTPPPPEEVTTTSTADSDQNYGTAMHSSRVAFVKSKEMGRFLHHYRRWNAHAESALLERNMGKSVTTRLAPVVREAIDFSRTPDFDFSGRGLSFVHAAFTELLECRSVLQHSYAFCFFRYPLMSSSSSRRSRNSWKQQRERERHALEQVQSELEMITEQMSDIVARRHLRASQIQIMFLTQSACEKRVHFQNFMWKILQQERREEVIAATTEKKRSNKREPSPFDADSDMMMMSSQTVQHPRQQLRRLMDTYPSHYRSSSSYTTRRLVRLPSGNDSDYSDEDHHVFGGGSYYDGGGGFFSNNNDEDDAILQQALQASMASYQTESNTNNTDDDDDDEVFEEMWSCSSCTYMNTTTSSNTTGRQQCAICGIAR